LRAKPTLPSLATFAYNNYSQFGEDGIIEKIFETIGTKSKLCIEFGAWDGFFASNTANLWTKHGWQAILIESDQKKAKQLHENLQRYPACTAICAHVGNKSPNLLEEILTTHNMLPATIDLLSIDIDDNDYYVFETLNSIHPRIIICEYNPTLPPELDIHFPPDSYWGCSAGSLIRLAHAKGYELIAMTDTNCFFCHQRRVSTICII